MTFTVATWLLVAIPMPMLIAISLISYLKHRKMETELGKLKESVIRDFKLSDYN